MEDASAPVGGAIDGSAAPARIVVDDDLRRTRLTALFRLFLALPYIAFLAAWSVLMVVVGLINWVAVVLARRPLVTGLVHRYLRYWTHVAAYLTLAANPFPGFVGGGRYPVDLEVSSPHPQSRLTAVPRALLALPAFVLAVVLLAPAASYTANGATEMTITLGVVPIAAFLGWFVSVGRGRMAHGLRDVIAYALGYAAQLIAYLLFADERYPNSDPQLPRYGQLAPDHPIRITADDDLRRSRMTVFFRLPLWLPHLVWLLLWGVAVLAAVIACWLVTLLAGRPPMLLHRFIGAYVRYATHATAFLYLIANPFPGFTGREGAYPIDLRIASPSHQPRWKTLLRLILSLPALFVAGALANALLVVAVFGWFATLTFGMGRMPPGLRNLGAFALRYNAQVWAYLALLTDRYPFAGPSLELVPLPAADHRG